MLNYLTWLFTLLTLLGSHSTYLTHLCYPFYLPDVPFIYLIPSYLPGAQLLHAHFIPSNHISYLVSTITILAVHRAFILLLPYTICLTLQAHTQLITMYSLYLSVPYVSYLPILRTFPVLPITYLHYLALILPTLLNTHLPANHITFLNWYPRIQHSLTNKTHLSYLV